MVLRKPWGMGLNIGSRKIKLISLYQEGNAIRLERYGSIIIPPGVIESGIIHKPQYLGEALGEMVSELNYKNKRVISAVSGAQVYTRILVMPRMKLSELKPAVKYEATTFLPIPIEQAAMDIYPLRQFKDEEGAKVEVFFIAVRRQQVDSLDLVCRIAGLRLNVVEIEQLALQRLFNNFDQKEIIALLNIGFNRSYLSVFQGNILVFNRYLSIGLANLATNESGIINQNNIREKNSIIHSGQPDHLVREIVAEVALSVEYFHFQNLGSLDKIIICGGSSYLTNLATLLATEIHCEVQIADPLSCLILPEGVTDNARRELQQDFAVAIGLAMRGLYRNA